MLINAFVICLGYVGFFEAHKLFDLGMGVTNNKYIDPSSIDYWYFGYEQWRLENSKFIGSFLESVVILYLINTNLFSVDVPWPSSDVFFVGNVSLYVNSSDGMRHQKDVLLDLQKGFVMVSIYSSISHFEY